MVSMDLWIGVERNAEACELRLEGRLAGATVAELDRVVEELELPIRVDLSQLFSADDAGIEALQALRSNGAELLGTRPLIQQRVEAIKKEKTEEESER